MVKIKSTTQDFTEIADVFEDIVFFKGGNMCTILEVSSVNFSLLSTEEQDIRLFGYMALLNSLSLPLQLLMVSKKINISAYLDLINKKLLTIKHPLLVEHLTHFRDFIKNLIKGEELLDKKIYVIIPFSAFELGPVVGARATATSLTSPATFKKIKQELAVKKNHVATQLQRIGLSSRSLEGEEIIKLFYELFNGEPLSTTFNPNDVKNLVL